MTVGGGLAYNQPHTIKLWLKVGCFVFGLSLPFVLQLD